MNYIKSVKIKVDYPNTNTIIDITQYVILESIRIQDRDDLAFGRGGFKFKAPASLGLTKNIAPYSICEITLEGADDERIIYQFVMSSVATYFITQNAWIHDCTLMSLDSVLETLILGAKTVSFSNNANDLVSLNKILTLVNNKYGSEIVINGSYLSEFSNDYSFPIGTTLFDVIKEYVEKNDIRYIIRFTEDTDGYIDSETSVLGLTITFNANSYTTQDIPTSYIEYEEYNQNTDNYCKYIETQANDVIDRDTLMKVKYLSPRSTNGVLVSVNEAKLVLPVNVESIEKLEIISSSLGRAAIDTTILDSNMDGYALQNTFSGTHTTSSGYDIYDGVLQQFIDADFRAKKTTNSVTTIGSINLFEKIWDDFFDAYEITNQSGVVQTTMDIVVHTVIGSYQGVQTFTITFKSNDDSGLYKGLGVVDYSDRVVEESVWNGLPVADQPKYLVYKSGTNIIYNMNGSYRDDFWGHITDSYQGNFLTEAEKLADINLYSNTIGFTIRFTGDSDTNPLHYQYNVECYAFANPYLIDSKNGAPSNEITYKPMGRTYSMGDSNGFEIDFKALTTDMDKQNEILGRTEHIAEINTTNMHLVSMTEGYRLPKAKERIRFGGVGGEYWFVASLEHRFNKGHNTTQLNLAKKQTKIADAIGVDYQYNPTLLPLNNILDRPLFYEIENNTLYNWLVDIAEEDSVNDTFVAITFNNILGSGINKTLLKRPVVQLTSDYAVLYVETIDNVVFDYAVLAKDPSYETYPLEPSRYVDNFGQCESVSVNINCTNQRLTLDNSKLLPSNNAIFGKIYATYSVATNEYIYKDQRERLTFTIKINKGGIL